ncbi:hypothetical protein BH23BAC3_BH23BAC3_01140 [soil metagenome]
MSMSLGKDLALIRTHLGYSIEDIQKATKISIYTLQSIEDGTIFTEQNEINTYIRSFVRTYGRAIKVDEDLLSRALDQEELGNYNHLLLQDYPAIRKKKGIEIEPDFEPEDKTDSENDSAEVGDDEKEETPGTEFEFKESKKPRPVESSRASSTPDLRNINWAGIGFDSRKKRVQTPVWIISAGLIVILLVAAAILITQFGLFSSDELPREDTPTEESATGATQDLSLGLADQAPEDQTPVAELGDTLQLTLYAAYDRLNPVRVWSDLKPRIDPYWIDEGTAFNFEFQDTINIRGSYSDMLLFLNGNRIDNFRSQHFNDNQNAVELTRSVFDEDPRWATPVPLELPGDAADPDTVIPRPSY